MFRRCAKVSADGHTADVVWYLVVLVMTSYNDGHFLNANYGLDEFRILRVPKDP